MHIKRRLQINSVGIVLLALAIFSVLFVTSARVNRALQASKVAKAIFVSSYERLLLRTDLYRTGSERSKVQMIAKQKEVGDLLQRALRHFPAAEDQRTIRELISRHESIGYLSRSIGERRAQMGSGASQGPLIQEAEDLLFGQLTTNIYESVLLQGKLLEASQKEVDSSIVMAGIGILLVLVLVASVVLTNSVIINRIFAARIQALRRGTTVIGAGDLDHRIVVQGDDEFGELAASFNGMATKLGLSYRELEGEIEERRRAESALRHSEEKFALAFANNPAAIVLTRLEDGLVLDVNETWLALWGYSRDEIVGSRARGMWPSDQEAARFLRELEQHGSLRGWEQAFRSSSGRLFVVQLSAQLMTVAGERVILSTLVDITERKNAEERVRESEEQFRALADSIPNLAWWANGEGYIIWYNQRWYQYTGTTPEQMEGWGWQSVHDPEKLPEVLERWRESIRTGRPFDMVFPLRGADGVFRPFLTRVMPVFDDQGKVVRWFGTNTDITERKQFEETIENSLREKEVLLKEIHHRVKNNLQVISSLVSLQAGLAADQVVREILNEVSYRVRSMALVHEKLYRSADLAHIDFADYLDSLLTYIWRAHGSAAASVRLTLDLEPVSLPVDTAVPCGLIMNELATNALKHGFRPGQEGEVTVSLKQDRDGTVRLRVADNGAGLPEGLDWRQASSLGLRLVQMLAGQLEAEVTVGTGQGTAFDLIMKSQGAAAGSGSDDAAGKGAHRD